MNGPGVSTPGVSTPGWGDRLKSRVGWLALLFAAVLLIAVGASCNDGPSTPEERPPRSPSSSPARPVTANPCTSRRRRRRSTSATRSSSGSTKAGSPTRRSSPSWRRYTASSCSCCPRARGSTSWSGRCRWRRRWPEPPGWSSRSASRGAMPWAAPTPTDEDRALVASAMGSPAAAGHDGDGATTSDRFGPSGCHGSSG